MDHDYTPLCSGCGEQIHPGQYYYDATEFFPSQPDRTYVHDRCVEDLVARYRSQLVDSCRYEVDELLSAMIRELYRY